jgi:2-polyprenyl-3-methyl-5-hydroxy-6-metoxy-1,4-benzoquinol methylase
MDIEDYARTHPTFLTDEVEPHLAEWLERRPGGTLLDAGCGDGSLLIALGRRGSLDGRRVIGVDLSETRVASLRHHLPGSEAHVDDVETLETIDSASIDVLVSTQVLEHVDDGKMLAAIRRVLAPDGVAYVSTVFKRPWARFIWRTADGAWALDPTHVREYERDEEVFDRLPGLGLELVEQRKTPISYPVVDFVVRRIGAGSPRAFTRPGLRRLRALKVPVPGYFTWSFVIRSR